jgi:hypothetical protein
MLIVGHFVCGMAHKMWHASSWRRTMLGAFAVARSKPYLEHIWAYIIAFWACLGRW